MIDILAQAASGITTGLASGITSAGMTALIIKHITNSGRHMNGKKYQSLDVCTERHKSIGRTLERIEKKLDKALGD